MTPKLLFLVGFVMVLAGCENPNQWQYRSPGRYSEVRLQSQNEWQPVDCSEEQAPECVCHDADPDYVTCQP